MLPLFCTGLGRRLKKYRENHVPLDMVYMDIDYMQDYKDFTVNEERFPDFEGFVQDMKKESLPNSRAVRNRELPLREHW